MAPVHGSKAKFALGTNAVPGTPTDASALISSIGVAFSRDSGDASTLGVTSKKYVPGLKDATIPLEGPFDTALDLHLWDLFNSGVLANFRYRPAGDGTGLPEYTGQCFITTYESTSDVGDVGAASCEMQVSGDVARAVQA